MKFWDFLKWFCEEFGPIVVWIMIALAAGTMLSLIFIAIGIANWLAPGSVR